MKLVNFGAVFIKFGEKTTNLKNKTAHTAKMLRSPAKTFDGIWFTLELRGVRKDVLCYVFQSLRTAGHGYLVLNFKDRRRYRREWAAESLPTARAEFARSCDTPLGRGLRRSDGFLRPDRGGRASRAAGPAARWSCSTCLQRRNLILFWIS